MVTLRFKPARRWGGVASLPGGGVSWGDNGEAVALSIAGGAGEASSDNLATWLNADLPSASPVRDVIFINDGGVGRFIAVMGSMPFAFIKEVGGNWLNTGYTPGNDTLDITIKE